MHEVNDIVNISIEQIYPHPDNPRKDLGDLSELSESIRKNGIMQNLTVIPGHCLTDEEYKEAAKEYDENTTEEQRTLLNQRWKEDGYTLLIGHRRHAAACLAGIEILPCRIVTNMSMREQISTMLEENMQRSDLTIWEQANGFQLMLDLGDTEEQIVEKTGFSKTTIRHRLNIAKLDQKELKKKELDETFQLTLGDLYALEKIDDIKTRNKILKEAYSSSQLKAMAQREYDDAQRNIRIKQLGEMLEAEGCKKATEKMMNERWGSQWTTVKEYHLDNNVPESLELPQGDDKLYYGASYRTMVVMKASKCKNEEETEYQKAQKEKTARKNRLKEKVNELRAQGKDIVTNIIDGKIDAVKDEDAIRERIWRIFFIFGTGLYKTKMTYFFTQKDFYNMTEEEKEESTKLVNNLSFTNSMLVAMIQSITSQIEITDYQGHYEPTTGQFLWEVFSILTEYGYVIDPEAERIMNGTHELFEKPEE